MINEEFENNMDMNFREKAAYTLFSVGATLSEGFEVVLESFVTLKDMGIMITAVSIENIYDKFSKNRETPTLRLSRRKK